MTARPNILFVLSDQQRHDTLGCYGQRLAVTPNLDRLAAEGVRFEHAFTCQPVCGPARACLQTGVYATENGCFTNNRALREDAVTIAKLLGEVGYETAYVGKWHLSSDAEHRYRTQATPPARRGGYRDYWVAADTLEFTSHGYEGYMFDGEGKRVDWEGYRVDRTADFMLDYLRDYAGRAPDRPFFAFLSFIEPHHQNDLNRYVGPIGSKQRFKDHEVPGDLAGTDGDWRQHYPDYLGCCASIDENVGRLRAELQRLGLADNTLIIYSSDHASHFRTRNGEYKRSCHDNSIRVPLVMCGPGFVGGQVRDELVSLIDLPATVLTAAEVDVPAQMRGNPLQDLVSGGAVDWPQEVFVQISESQVGRAVRTAGWKYGVVAPDLDGGSAMGSGRYVEAYLYDLQADPYERDNRAADPNLAEVRAELAATLKRRMLDAGEAEPVIEPCA